LSVLFGKWMNTLPTVAAAGVLGAVTVAVGGFWYYATPKFWQVGYMPTQPGTGFNHQLHVGKLGMDCRYCHTNVEISPEANIPNVATCYGCHAENNVSVDFVPDQRVQFVRTAYANDESIAWRRAHKLADFVRNFPHDAHVRAGVSCYSCHGQIASMPVVFQTQPLSMGWCLDCHRALENQPELYLVPPDQVTNVLWVEQHLQNVQAGRGEGEFSAREILESLRLNPPQNCGACHH
jgi:hypothetical protein